MNPLRSPWVTGLLAIIAVAVVWHQLFPPQHFPSAPPPSQIAPASLQAASPRDAAPTLNVSGKPSEPTIEIDRDYVQSHLAQWIAAPSHDPFQVYVPIVAADTNSPVIQPRWRLKAIWRQDGSNLAAINGGVYGEGDSIDGYKIERIEDDQVLLQGPKLRERLTFDKIEVDTEAVAVPATNSTNQASPEKSEPAKIP